MPSYWRTRRVRTPEGSALHITSVAALPTQPAKEHAASAKVRLAAKAVRLGGSGTFGREASSALQQPLRLGYGTHYQHGPARYIEGSLSRRTRDLDFLPAGTAHSDLERSTHSYAPPTLSDESLHSVQLGYPPQPTTGLTTWGPSRLRAVNRLPLAVHCQPVTGAGYRQLDPVTSIFLPDCPTHA